MSHVKGRVLELTLGEDGEHRALIEVPPESLPAPGRYLQAHDPAAGEEPLAVSLFATDRGGSLPRAEEDHRFLAAPPIPSSWHPGTDLCLRGPLGRGFQPPGEARRLALAALGETPARLLPLAAAAVGGEAEAALFCDTALPALPSAVEALPLRELPEALRWADFLALDVPLDSLANLRPRLGLEAGGAPPCPTETLVYAPMPCGGLAECGVCAVPAGRKWRLACKDGPVFPLEDLEW